MFYEFLVILSFIIQGGIFANHLIYYNYAKTNNIKYPGKLYIINISFFFATAFVLRYALKNIESESNIHLVAIPLAIAFSFITYKVLSKLHSKGKHNKSFKMDAAKKRGADLAPL